MVVLRAGNIRHGCGTRDAIWILQRGPRCESVRDLPDCWRLQFARKSFAQQETVSGTQQCLWVLILLCSPLNGDWWKSLASYASYRALRPTYHRSSTPCPLPQPPDLRSFHLDDAGSSRVCCIEKLARPHHGRGGAGEGYRRGHRGAAIGNG